ncbi:MAG: FAD-binding oxidoreductase [Pseudomonadota bacterium]|nr:FAD-binding oxidoreductase [Pseudomonadota bacterium]
MATCIIPMKEVLLPEEYRLIDDYASTGHPVKLKDLATFLADKFGLKISLDQDIVTGFSTDSSNLPGHAEALCRPESERECAIIMRACYAARIPMTISAGQSNLTGSATAEGGMVISLGRMTNPQVSVDIEKKRVTVPVGMVLEDMRNLVLEQSGQKLYYPADPTSRSDAWIGGTIACNASGFIPGEIGATREWVEEISFLLPNGLKIQAKRGQYRSEKGFFRLQHGEETIDWPVPTYPRPSIKNASGPFSAADGKMDFIDLIVGSEGLFGLVTAAVFKLAPRPTAYLDLFFSLPGEQEALKFQDYLYRHLDGDFGRLAALEYFGINCRRYMDHENRLFHGDNQVAIYIQVPLAGESLDSAPEEWFNLLLESNCGIEAEAVILLDNEPMKRTFMEARHSMPANALELVQQRGTYTIMTDTVVPQEQFPAFLQYVHQILTADGVDYLSFGHFGDSHLHFTVLPEKSNLERATELYDLIIAKSAELGGVYSGEHGTGKRKRKDFFRCFNQEAIEQVKRCKTAVDPNFILNRGNVFQP